MEGPVTCRRGCDGADGVFRGDPVVAYFLYVFHPMAKSMRTRAIAANVPTHLRPMSTRATHSALDTMPSAAHTRPFSHHPTADKEKAANNPLHLIYVV